MKHLVVVLPPVPVASDQVQLADKTVTGLKAFVERWPGRVTAVGPAVKADVAGNLGLQWYAPDQLDLDIQHGDPTEVIRRLSPDVLHLSLAVRERPLLELGIPGVIFAENPAVERLRYAWSGSPPTHKPRMLAGAARQELVQRSMVRRAAALACNGWNAWRWYAETGRRAHDHEPILVFDSRLPEGRVAEAEHRVRAAPMSIGPLRLGFSGRLHSAKGAQHAVAASQELERRGVDHRLALFGTGPLELELRRIAGSSVCFVGEIGFDPAWMDRVPKEVDLMLLPHTQGDPSGTYLESAGLGVPIAGFANAALSGFEREGGFAWTSSRRTSGSLADLVERLHSNRSMIHEGAVKGVQFAQRHGFEKAFDRRVDQLMRVAGI